MLKKFGEFVKKTVIIYHYIKTISRLRITAVIGLSLQIQCIISEDGLNHSLWCIV